jgi:hypothetical protein
MIPVSRKERTARAGAPEHGEADLGDGKCHEGEGRHRRGARLSGGPGKRQQSGHCGPHQVGAPVAQVHLRRRAVEDQESRSGSGQHQCEAAGTAAQKHAEPCGPDQGDRAAERIEAVQEVETVHEGNRSHGNEEVAQVAKARRHDCGHHEADCDFSEQPDRRRERSEVVNGAQGQSQAEWHQQPGVDHGHSEAQPDCESDSAEVGGRTRMWFQRPRMVHEPDPESEPGDKRRCHQRGDERASGQAQVVGHVHGTARGRRTRNSSDSVPE